MSAVFPLAFEPSHRTPGLSEHTVLYFVFRKRELLITLDGALPVDLSGLNITRTQYLGALNGVHCVSAELPADTEPQPGFEFRGLRRLYRKLDRSLHAVAGRAVQVVEWDRTHQFCGACGTPTERSDNDRSRQCPSCRIPLYPRLAPAMIVAVERGDQLLLARSPHFPPGIFSMLAGFVEPGESAEDAVIREVFEETRIVVDQVRYFGSQPWPFPNSLMLGFIAQYKSGEIDLADDELEAAGRYTVDTLPKTFPGNVSISQWLLKDFIARHSAPETPSTR